MIDKRDLRFWSRQSREHLMFMSSSADTNSGWRAYEIQVSWNRNLSVEEAIALNNRTRDLELKVAARAKTGAFVGFLGLDFYDHIAEEAKYFDLMLRGKITPEAEVEAWADILGDHAESIGAMLDTSQGKMREHAHQMWSYARMVSEYTRDRTAAVTLRSFERELNRFIDRTRRVPSTIIDGLREHAIREGEHFRKVVLPRLLKSFS